MLTLSDLTIRLGGRVLLDQASAQIAPAMRVGLVGRNGAGKSSLFAAICGDIETESGRIALPPRWRIGRLAQEAPSGPEPLIDVVLAADTERAALLAEAEDSRDPHRIADIQTRLADIAAHSAESRAATILAGLGFSHADQRRPCSEFSGGWRMRVALAATLFAEPDLLLLDEPTNYLDLEGTLWLEEHLASYPRTVIVISHDRDLLENSVNHILHLSGRKLSLYRGNYSAFERLRAERELMDRRHAKKQASERARLEKFVERFRAKATKARQAQSRLKLLARMEPVAAIISEEVRDIVFPAPQRMLSPPIIAVDGATVGYDPATPVLSRVTLRIDEDDRIALLGANGNGKSTLVKLIAGRLQPFAGTITRADKMAVAYFAQHQLEELNPQATPYDHVRKLMPEAGEARIRARAGSIGFPEAMADTRVEKLSGGEKARLLLGLATFHGPHLIILDEPTNHLDIDSRAALIEAINEFPGAVIMVSHDRYLIEACADRLWVVAEGRVTPFDGDLDDYRRFVLGRASDTDTDMRSTTGRDDGASRSEQRRLAADRRESLAPLRQKISQAEQEIARIEEVLAKIDGALTADLFTRDAAKAAQLAKARAATQKALERAENQWLAASSAYETAQASR